VPPIAELHRRWRHIIADTLLYEHPTSAQELADRALRRCADNFPAMQPVPAAIEELVRRAAVDRWTAYEAQLAREKAEKSACPRCGPGRGRLCTDCASAFHLRYGRARS
jgi:hypothetical protein